MGAATENLKPKSPNGDWTVVLPRRGKQRRKALPKPETSETKPWAPTDSKTDPQSELRLLQKIQVTLKRVESSHFYHSLVAQLQTPQLAQNLSRVLFSEPRLQMVIYGIGSIEWYDPPRLQLSLAILLARQFDWIGQIEIFDPIISLAESRVMEALGCKVLSIDEQGRRETKKPTLFFMPHCEAVLYDNLLETNWRMEQLNQMVVFGNSFKQYEQFVSEFKSSMVANSARYVLEATKFAEEIKIETDSDDYFKAFHDTSWHFFNLDSEMEMSLSHLNFKLEGM